MEGKRNGSNIIQEYYSVNNRSHGDSIMMVHGHNEREDGNESLHANLAISVTRRNDQLFS